MTSFPGFPKNMRFAGFPKLFLTEVMPYIDDIAELKVTIYLLHILLERKGYPRFVTEGELLGDKAIMTGLHDGEALRRGLEKAVSRGTILSLGLDRAGEPVGLYFLNTDADRDAYEKVKRGEIDIGALPYREPYTETESRANIFALYEENIGMLTPMIAEELKDAERLYPESWIEDAFKQAVGLNKRSWRYVEAILKRWASEGRDYGARGRDSKEDPDRYIKGKYGHLVKRRID